VIGLNAPDGKGNVTAYVGYSHLDPITQAKRDFSACSLSESGNGFRCAGSGTSPGGEFIIFDQNFNYVVDTPTGSGAGASFRPFTSADQYNFAPLNYYLRQDERYNGGFFAHYEVNPRPRRLFAVHVHGRPHPGADRAQRCVWTDLHHQL
jgi:hypothetical protein